jgi:lipopolysaccharide transport protein LptA
MQRLPAGVVGPAAFDVPLVAEPEASQVREWAEGAGVEAVVFGKTTPATAGVGVEVEVRAGHSGVAMANYQVALVTLEDPVPEIDALAEQILTGLGYEPPAPPPAAMEEAEDSGSRFSLIREGESISIESDELEVTQDGDERHLIFNRAVRVELSDLRLRTDRLDAYYKKGEGQPDRLVATGSVRVQQGDRQARCDVATFQNSNQYVVCTGHAALRQGCDLVRGTEIRFDLEEESVRVIGAASVVIQGTRDGDCSGEDW